MIQRQASHSSFFPDFNQRFLLTLTVNNAEDMWPDVNERINAQIKNLDLAVKHVNDLNSYSKASRELEVKNIATRHALMPEEDEKASFPMTKLPQKRNENFYGRQSELDDMFHHLRPNDEQPFRTYTIYGKRGVGKTAIALQFAYTNARTYDAIFWIQCETSVTIRQSFTNVAVALNIPAADRDGRHKENQIAVQDWLKKTSIEFKIVFMKPPLMKAQKKRGFSSLTTSVSYSAAHAYDEISAE